MDMLETLAWMKAHPEFEEVPASVEEFVGDKYLNIADRMRPAVMEELKEMFGSDVRGDRMALVRYAIFTGAIGIGKTTVASIVLPYMAHWCLCLKDPQGFFNLLPGSRIAFMMMSTSEKQAREVLFGDIDARIKYSPWFQKYPKDPKYKNQIRFDKDIWIVPGDSQETTFEGYNILGGIIDEADSHKVTEEKDYADTGFDTIDGRIASRFKEKGFLLVVGQMKKANGFAARKFKDFRDRPDGRAARLTIWESFGWQDYLGNDGNRDSFYYDIKRKTIVPSLIAKELDSEQLIEVPTLYRRQFENNPEKSLKDLAGIPPAVGDPFISLVDRIEECRDKWVERYNWNSPIAEDVTRPRFVDREWRGTDSLKRACHIDLAYSGNGDACGIAIGHVRQVVDIDGEKKPYIIFDLLARIRAAPGTEIMLSEIRHFLYYVRDDLKFKIKTVTLDGFQSTDTMQQLRKRRFFVDYVSVDKDLLPYYDLREAIYERRVEFPKYITYWKAGDTEKVEIAVKELMELEDNGKKIDHPEGGSKDVADAMAGVTYTLMGDRSFRKGTTNFGGTSEGQVGSPPNAGGTPGSGLWHPAMGSMAGGGMTAPVPPRELDSLGLLPHR